MVPIAAPWVQLVVVTHQQLVVVAMLPPPVAIHRLHLSMPLQVAVAMLRRLPVADVKMHRLAAAIAE